VIAVVATDAPLLPGQCKALARRVPLGLARTGTTGGHFSGDIFLAFSTANGEALHSYKEERPNDAFSVTMLPDEAMSDLFWGAIESTEEAICNALIAAQTMVGRDGITARALPHDALVEIMRRYGRGPHTEVRT